MPFSHWTIDKGTLEISDLTVQNLSFAMPAQEVAMTAHYAQEKYHREGGQAEKAAECMMPEAPPRSLPTRRMHQAFRLHRWEVTEGSRDSGLQWQKTEKFPLTMPSEKVSVKAVYEAGDRYSVMVFGGSGAGRL